MSQPPPQRVEIPTKLATHLLATLRALLDIDYTIELYNASGTYPLQLGEV